MTATEPSAEAQETAERLNLAVVHLMRRMRREDDGLGIGGARLSALTTLYGHGSLSLGELAELEQVKPPSMTRLVQKLEADGLVIRERSEADARSYRVRVTSRAIGVLEAGRRHRAASLAREIGALSSGDRKALERALSVLERLSGGAAG